MNTFTKIIGLKLSMPPQVERVVRCMLAELGLVPGGEVETDKTYLAGATLVNQAGLLFIARIKIEYLSILMEEIKVEYRTNPVLVGGVYGYWVIRADQWEWV